jgi:uncharacterized protein with HEPN domain
MKHPERVKDYLEHIPEPIQRATSYIRDFKDAEALQQDPRTQDAVIRNIEIIDEAANHIRSMSPAFADDHAAVPWLEMRRMRNKVIHEYFDVDWNLVWDTVNDGPARIETADRPVANRVSSAPGRAIGGTL